jgi:integrase
MSKLSKRKVDSLNEPGFYGDGEGLYLSVKPSGSKSWILRTMVQGKRRDLGLGASDMVTLAEVRERARELRKIARAGGDPYAQRDARQLTFEQAAYEFHAIRSQSFSSGKHAQLWLSGLKHHAFPVLGQQPLESIRVSDVRRVLEPIWTEKHETARRVKQRIEAIFEWAKAEGHFEGDNPCSGIKYALKPQRRNPVHHRALPWSDLPEFYRQLDQRGCVSARALQFIILTACRSREVREAKWTELQAEVWTVPQDRTKMRRPHRVPLSNEARRIIEHIRGLDDTVLFPSSVQGSQRRGKPISVNAFRPLFQRMGCGGLTAHGFRSTFRDWCSEATEAPREVAEAALAHSVGEVERAYRRSDLFERRAALMRQWADFAATGQTRS